MEKTLWTKYFQKSQGYISIQNLSQWIKALKFVKFPYGRSFYPGREQSLLPRWKENVSSLRNLSHSIWTIFRPAPKRTSFHSVTYLHWKWKDRSYLSQETYLLQYDVKGKIGLNNWIIQTCFLALGSICRRSIWVLSEANSSSSLASLVVSLVPSPPQGWCWTKN